MAAIEAQNVGDLFNSAGWKPPAGLTDAQIKDKFRSFPVGQESPHSCALNAAMAGVIGANPSGKIGAFLSCFLACISFLEPHHMCYDIQFTPTQYFN